MPSLVNGDYSNEAKKKGTTIDVELPAEIATQDVTPSTTPETPADYTPTTVQVPLDQWKQNTPFVLTDKEFHEIDTSKNYLPSAVDSAIKGLANLINEHLLAQYTGVYGYTGTAGSTPFASTPEDATAARKILTQQLCPKRGRQVVLDHDAEENALNLTAFADVSQAGSTDTKREGEIGRKYGMDWYADHAVPTHTAGTSSGALVNNASVAVGDTSVPCDTGTGTMVVGDIFTVAGDTQTYVVTTAVADVSSGTVAFDPPAKVAWADNAAITLKASHVVNLAFRREAFAFATRRLQDVVMNDSSLNTMSIQDPISGLILRLEVSRQHKQTAWEFDILWGAKLVRPELACRIAG